MVITAAICTSGIVGRTHTVGYIIIGFLLAGIVQPFLIHWIWTPHGWMRRNVLNKQHVHFHDYTGSVVIHVVGGLTGLIGCLTLGRRILRLDAIDEASIAVGASGNVFAGYLLVFIGLQVKLYIINTLIFLSFVCKSARKQYELFSSIILICLESQSDKYSIRTFRNEN